jgi:hypothetical protein
LKRLKLVTISLLSLLTLAGLLPLIGLAANLLTNSGLNAFDNIPDRLWRDQNEKIATGWSHFYIAANTYPGSGDASKLHWMSDDQFDLNFGSPPYDGYQVEGSGAQNMWSSYEFEAGIYQQITGLTAGQDYGFDISIVTYWRGPGYPDSDGIMVKQVGLDPYGGTDPTSSNIIWSEPDGDDKRWVYMDVAATAQAATITVFAKVQAPENDSYNHTDLDMVYFDAAHVDLASSTTLNVSTSGTTVNLNWSGSAPADWSIKGYEVQYKDQTGGGWVTLQSKTGTNTSGSFVGQAGHTYTIRARTWQTMSEGYNSDIDMPGVWVEKSVTIGEAVVGQVTNHAGIGLSGVTVSVSGTTTSTQSTNGGNYTLPTGAAGAFDIVASNFNGLLAPPATAVTVTSNTVGVLTITLRSTGTDQAIRNNDFETDLSNWNVSDGSAASASNMARHTGNRSLWLSNTVSVSQTGVVSGMRSPLLSFWYKNNVPFTIKFLGEGIGGSSLGIAALSPVQTQTLEAVSDWTHFTFELGASDVYTGEVGVNFSYTDGAGANIFIDEVSIAAGPYKIYLPIVFKN